MRRLMLVVVVLLGAPCSAFPESNEARRPQDGGSRVLRLFPENGTTHLPDAMIEHGLPHALPNVTKDPRHEGAGVSGQASGGSPTE